MWFSLNFGDLICLLKQPFHRICLKEQHPQFPVQKNRKLGHSAMLAWHHLMTLRHDILTHQQHIAIGIIAALLVCLSWECRNADAASLHVTETMALTFNKRLTTNIYGMLILAMMQECLFCMQLKHLKDDQEGWYDIFCHNFFQKLLCADFKTLTVCRMRGFFDTFAHFSHWIVYLTEK